MNTRRFYLFISSFTMIILFVSGIFMLSYIKSFAKSGKDPTGGILADVLTDIKTISSPINVLVLGGDKVNGNTDTMMLVNFNPKKNDISILSIPRDTRVVRDGKAHKINYAYSAKKVGGPDLAMEVVEDLLGVNVDYYVFIDISAFRKIVDLMGGVDYYIPADMDYDDPTQDLHIHLSKGQQHLDGNEAEQFMRFRQPNANAWTKEIIKYYNKGDMSRVEAQQGFIKEFIKQKMNIIYLPKINKAISTIFNSIETNFKMSEILNLATYIGRFDPDEIKWFTLPGSDSDENGIYYYVKSKSKTNEIISEYFVTDAGYVPPATQTAQASGSAVKKTSEPTGASGDNPSNSDTGMQGSNTTEP